MFENSSNDEDSASISTNGDTTDNADDENLDSHFEELINSTKDQDPLPFSCQICNDKFKLNMQLHRHLSSYHELNSPDPDEEIFDGSSVRDEENNHQQNENNDESRNGNENSDALTKTSKQKRSLDKESGIEIDSVAKSRKKRAVSNPNYDEYQSDNDHEAFLRIVGDDGSEKD